MEEDRNECVGEVAINILVVFFLRNLERSALLSSARLQIRFEVFQQSHLFLQLFWEVVE